MAMKRHIYIIRITLSGSKPPIWRKLALPADTVLADLHEVIQIAMGWTNSHLHQFRLHDKGLKPSPQEMARRFQRDEWDDEFLGRMRGERVFVAKVASALAPALAPTSDRGRQSEADSGTRGDGRRHDGRDGVAKQSGRQRAQVAPAQRKTDTRRRPCSLAPLTGAMGRTGLEPVTSCVSSRRSSHLS